MHHKRASHPSSVALHKNISNNSSFFFILSFQFIAQIKHFLFKNSQTLKASSTITCRTRKYISYCSQYTPKNLASSKHFVVNFYWIIIKLVTVINTGKTLPLQSISSRQSLSDHLEKFKIQEPKDCYRSHT